MAPKRKLVELSIDKKKEVLDLIARGSSQRKLADQFGVAKSTIGNIAKNKDSIVNSWLGNCSNE